MMIMPRRALMARAFAAARSTTPPMSYAPFDYYADAAITAAAFHATFRYLFFITLLADTHFAALLMPLLPLMIVAIIT